MKQENCFENLSYRGQVKILTGMAHEAISKYGLKNPNLKFIHHGENATFYVKDVSCSEYLLRLHRSDYHTIDAISEELIWLNQLRKKISCQRPVEKIGGGFFQVVKDKSFNQIRICDLLTWQKGRKRYRNHSVESFFQLGELTAGLHNQSSFKSKHRAYWTADGLLGESAVFGSPVSLQGQFSNYQIYEECRQLVIKKLRVWQKTRKTKMGFIHADLHFGNIIWNGSEIVPIDFDDCGYGFFMYDLAITFLGSKHLFKRPGAEEKIMGYLLGYQVQRYLDGKDIEMIPWLILARKLAVLVWLCHRLDNPRYVPIFKKCIREDVPIFKQALQRGPKFDWLPV